MAKSAQIAKVGWWHDALIEWLITNPEKSLADAARAFNVTAAWLSTVKNSDAFKDAYDRRRGEHFSRVSLSVIEKVEVLADLALEETIDRLEQAPENISYGALCDTTDMALRALGFGKGRPEDGGDKHLHIHVSDVESLENARRRMREAQGNGGDSS